MGSSDMGRPLAGIARQTAHWATEPLNAASHDPSCSSAEMCLFSGTAFDLWRAAASVSRHLERAVLASVDMSWTQYLLLSMVHRHSAIRAVDAAALLAVVTEEVVIVGEQLQARGWVEMSRPAPNAELVITCVLSGDEIAGLLRDQLAREERRLLSAFNTTWVARLRMGLEGVAAQANATRKDTETPPARPDAT